MPISFEHDCGGGAGSFASDANSEVQYKDQLGDMRNGRTAKERENMDLSCRARTIGTGCKGKPVCCACRALPGRCQVAAVHALPLLSTVHFRVLVRFNAILQAV